jgi:hypothetical protein
MTKVGRGNLLSGGHTNAISYEDRRKAAEQNARPSNRTITNNREVRSFTRSQRTRTCEITIPKILSAVGIVFLSIIGHMFVTEGSFRAKQLKRAEFANKLLADPTHYWEKFDEIKEDVDANSFQNALQNHEAGKPLTEEEEVLVGVYIQSLMFDSLLED